MLKASLGDMLPFLTILWLMVVVFTLFGFIINK
jgi:hypothetical protein